MSSKKPTKKMAKILKQETPSKNSQASTKHELELEVSLNPVLRQFLQLKSISQLSHISASRQDGIENTFTAQNFVQYLSENGRKRIFAHLKHLIKGCKTTKAPPFKIELCRILTFNFFETAKWNQIKQVSPIPEFFERNSLDEAINFMNTVQQRFQHIWAVISEQLKTPEIEMKYEEISFILDSLKFESEIIKSMISKEISINTIIKKLTDRQMNQNTILSLRMKIQLFILEKEYCPQATGLTEKDLENIINMERAYLIKQIRLSNFRYEEFNRSKNPTLDSFDKLHTFLFQKIKQKSIILQQNFYILMLQFWQFYRNKAQILNLRQDSLNYLHQFSLLIKRDILNGLTSLQRLELKLVIGMLHFDDIFREMKDLHKAFLNVCVKLFRNMKKIDLTRELEGNFDQMDSFFIQKIKDIEQYPEQLSEWILYSKIIENLKQKSEKIEIYYEPSNEKKKKQLQKKKLMIEVAHFLEVMKHFALMQKQMKFQIPLTLYEEQKIKLFNQLHEYYKVQRKSSAYQIKSKLLLLAVQFQVDNFNNKRIIQAKDPNIFIYYHLIKNIPSQIQNHMIDMHQNCDIRSQTLIPLQKTLSLDQAIISRPSIFQSLQSIQQIQQQSSNFQELSYNQSQKKLKDLYNKKVQSEKDTILKSYKKLQMQISDHYDKVEEDFYKKNLKKRFQDEKISIKKGLNDYIGSLFMIKIKQKNMERTDFIEKYGDFLENNMEDDCMNEKAQSYIDIKSLIKIEKLFIEGNIHACWRLFEELQDKIFTFFQSKILSEKKVPQNLMFLITVYREVNRLNSRCFDSKQKIQSEAQRIKKNLEQNPNKYLNEHKFIPSLIDRVEETITELLEIKNHASLMVNRNKIDKERGITHIEPISQEELISYMPPHQLFFFEERKVKFQWVVSNKSQRQIMRISISFDEKNNSDIYTQIQRYWQILDLNVEGISKMIHISNQSNCIILQINLNYVRVDQILKKHQYDFTYIKNSKDIETIKLLREQIKGRKYTQQELKTQSWINQFYEIQESLIKRCLKDSIFMIIQLFNKQKTLPAQFHPSYIRIDRDQEYFLPQRYCINPIFIILQSVLKKQPLTQNKFLINHPYLEFAKSIQTATKDIIFSKTKQLHLVSQSFKNEFNYILGQMIIYETTPNSQNQFEDSELTFGHLPIFMNGYEKIVYFKTYYNRIQRMQGKSKQKNDFFKQYQTSMFNKVEKEQQQSWIEIFHHYYNYDTSRNSFHFNKDAIQDEVIIPNWPTSSTCKQFIEICPEEYLCPRYDHILGVLGCIRNVFCHTTYRDHKFVNDIKKISITLKIFPKLLTYIYSQQNIVNGEDLISIQKGIKMQTERLYQFVRDQRDLIQFETLTHSNIVYRELIGVLKDLLSSREKLLEKQIQLCQTCKSVKRIPMVKNLTLLVDLIPCFERILYGKYACCSQMKKFNEVIKNQQYITQGQKYSIFDKWRKVIVAAVLQ